MLFDIVAITLNQNDSPPLQYNYYAFKNNNSLNMCHFVFCRFDPSDL